MNSDFATYQPAPSAWSASRTKVKIPSAPIVAAHLERLLVNAERTNPYGPLLR
jgi:hypothetical protein